MNKKLFSLLAILLISALAVTQVSALGSTIIKTTLGSLITDITQSGLKSDSINYIFEVDAQGDASVVCTNYGGNQAPGQNYPHTEGKSSYGLNSSQISKNGRATFALETIPALEATPNIDPVLGGCPNPNWTATVDFVYYKSFTLTGWIDLGGGVKGDKVLEKVYSCVTTRTGPNLTASTFDDGTVSCTLTSTIVK